MKLTMKIVFGGKRLKKGVKWEKRLGLCCTDCTSLTSSGIHASPTCNGAISRDKLHWSRNVVSKWRITGFNAFQIYSCLKQRLMLNNHVRSQSFFLCNIEWFCWYSPLKHQENHRNFILVHCVLWWKYVVKKIERQISWTTVWTYFCFVLNLVSGQCQWPWTVCRLKVMQE